MSCFQAAEPPQEELCHPSFSAPGATGSLRNRKRTRVNNMQINCSIIFVKSWVSSQGGSCTITVLIRANLYFLYKNNFANKIASIKKYLSNVLVFLRGLCMFDKHVWAKSNFQPFCKNSEDKCCHLPADKKCWISKHSPSAKASWYRLVSK